MTSHILWIPAFFLIATHMLAPLSAVQQYLPEVPGLTDPDTDLCRAQPAVGPHDTCRCEPGPVNRLNVTVNFRRLNRAAIGDLVESVRWFSVVDTNRLHATAHLAKAALKTVPGDFVETGVYCGGSSILMALILKHYDHCSRRHWGFDSFQGLPDPVTFDRMGSLKRGGRGSFKCGPLDEVRRNFMTEGAWDPDMVRLVPGWFNDTLPVAKIASIAFLRLDGDLFVSTWDVLIHLYDKVVPGGYILVDDYGSHNGCREAVDLYRYVHRIYEPMHWIYERHKKHMVEGVWWRKAGGHDDVMEQYAHKVLHGRYRRL